MSHHPLFWIESITLYVLPLIAWGLAIKFLVLRRLQQAERPLLKLTRYRIALGVMCLPIALDLIGIQFDAIFQQHLLWAIAGIGYLYVAFASFGLRSREKATFIGSMMLVPPILATIFSPLVAVGWIFLSTFGGMNNNTPFKPLASAGDVLCGTRDVGLAVDGGDFEVRVFKSLGHGITRVYYDQMTGYAQQNEPDARQQCDRALARFR